MRLDVLRAEANGTILDVLLRVELPGVAEELRPRDVAVFIAPADLSAAAAATAQFRLPRLFLKRMGKAYYIDLRQLPAGVGAAACQLLLRIGRDGELVATHRLARLLGPPAEELDVALLIDESLSMRRTDPEKLRIAAAKTFVDLARRSTRIGRIAVVGFNNKARTLAPLTSPLQAESLYRAIDRAGAIGQTDMDSALDEAWKAFGHSPTAAKAVVLLTDGRDEPGRYENAHRRFAAQRWRVYTVGLSKRADTTVLQRIAHDTGGEYHNAPTNAELQDIFGRICLTLQKKVPIRSRRHDLPAGGLVADPFAVDDSISALTVSLKARDPDVAFSLLDPATRPLTPDVKGAGRAAAYDRKAAYQYYDLWSPAPGQWAARLQAPHAQGVTVAATAVTNLLLRAFPLQPTCYRGEPVELAASLAVADSVLGHAQVEARVTPADGTTTTVPLFDDGRHHDTDADDGVFAGLFPGTETPGPCTIRLVATGTTPAGHRFERELSLTTTVATEGYSKLWCANRSLDFGVLYSGETATRALDLKLTSALDAPIAETIRAALQPPARPDGKRLPDAALRLSPRPLSLETGRLASVTLALSVPHAQPAGRYRGQLELASKYDRVTIPIQAEVRHPRLVLSPESIDLGSLESGSRAEARFAMRLEPRGALEARATGSDPRLALAPQAATLGPKPTEVTIALAAPADLPSTTIRATVTVQTPLGQAQLPVKAKVVKPAFVVSPTQVDFGELRPGQAATRAIDLRVTGLEPRRASVSAPPLTGPANVPALTLQAPADALTLQPGTEAPATLKLDVPPAQPPGAYRGTIVVRTPLGEHTVACTARVAAIDTFRIAAGADFGRVALGATKDITVEIESTVDAEQTISLSLPAPDARSRLTAQPTAATLPPRGKARLALRLAAPAGAKPGPWQASVGLRGPSLGVRLSARAELFRAPHTSLAFEPAELDVGRLQAGVDERLVVPLRSLVDEPQQVAVERIDAPAAVIAVQAEPGEWTLAARGSQPLTLTLRPAAGPDEEPFEATVQVRGRSLPATLRLRGSVFTPPAVTLAVEPAALDFGAVERGAVKTLPLTILSLYHREQKVSFGPAPASDGVALLAAAAGFHLPPGVERPCPARLAVASDARLGEHRLAWEVRGPGEPATLEARVEVVEPQRWPVVARSEPAGIGWAEAAAIFGLLLLLLAVLVAAGLLARWLIRTQRMPRMAKYFALSALVHALVLFTALDLLIARKVQKDKLGPTFKVGLKSVAGSFFSSRRQSVADALRERAERDRGTEATRRQAQAQRLARQLLEAQRRQLDPSQATLERPKPAEDPRLADPRADSKKHSAQSLAELLEQIREAERVRQTRQTTPDTPAATRAQRVARVRAMSRAELEHAVRQTLGPKAAEPTRPATPSDVPSLARHRAAPKAAPQLDELLPAIEGLRQELAEGAGGAPHAGALASRSVGTTRAGTHAAIERGTAAAERAAAQARSIAESTASGAEGGAASPLLQPSRPAPAQPKTAFAGFGVPHEAPAPAAGGARAAEPAAPGAGLGSREVGAARAIRRAAIERRAAGGPPGTAVAARDVGESSQPVPASRGGRPGLAIARPQAPATKAAAPGFGVPAETPAVDHAVRLPGSPGATPVEAKPVLVAPPAGGAATETVQQPAGTGAMAGASRPSLGARQGSLERPGVVSQLPGATAGSARAKAAPDLDDFVVEEGPLVAPRQGAPRGTGEPGERTVVARWRLRRRVPQGRGLVAVGPLAGSPAPAPRAGTVGRPADAAPSPGLGLGAATAAAPRQAPAWEAHPQEAVEPTPGIAAASDGGEAASAVDVTPASAQGTRLEHAGPPAGAASAQRPSLGPRGLATGPAGGPAQPLALPTGAATARRQAPAVGDAAPQEAVEAGPRIAARGPGRGPAEQDVAPPSVERATREIAREPRRTPRRMLSPRAHALARAPGRAASGLLLPGVSSRAGGAGAVVGAETGGVTRIVLTTVRYGSGEVDWDTHKTTMPFLAWQLRERIGFNIDTRIAEVPLESPRVMKSPWIYMSGHRNFRFTRDQAANLRRYLLGGGTLWADDSTHEDDFTWDKAFRREIARVLSRRDGHRLRKVTKVEDHPLFRSCFDLRDGYAGYWPPPGDKYRQSFIEGIELDGRLAVIYTRNDYGDGLEIKPDTFPLKASLSGLSPAEMQDASFQMATNVIVYILTRGRGVGRQGLLSRAAASLRHQHEARRTRRDEYADAPATLFDDFTDGNWDVEDEWDNAGSAKLSYGRREGGEPGRRLEVNYRLDDADDAKIVLFRDLPGELDVSGQDRCYVDIESQLEGGARLSLALITLPGWKYFESRPAFLKPGRNRVHFDLKAAAWKTGEPVAEGQSEHSRRIANPDSVRRFVLLLYPVGQRGTVVVDGIEFRARP